MQLWVRFLVKLKAQKVGTDVFGNTYHHMSKGQQNRRFVIFKKGEEASSVPPLWHAWLHHVTDTVPKDIQDYPWQKPFLPNLTGTPLAYHPKPSYFKADGNLIKPDYEAWAPPA